MPDPDKSGKIDESELPYVELVEAVDFNECEDLTTVFLLQKDDKGQSQRLSGTLLNREEV